MTEKRDVPSDQTAALLDMKERTGVFLLMGCSADRVSYESGEYGQGLLTYALLFGMRGAALKKRTEGEFVDVLTLFRAAADEVPRLAVGIGGVQRPLVSVGEGGSFDIGRLTAEDRAKVPLATKKPLVMRPLLLNRDEDEDDLKLGMALARRLAQASAAGRGRSPTLVYVPLAEDFPGAVRVSGSYTVRGDEVQLRLLLKRDGKQIARLNVSGKKGKLDELAAELVGKIVGATGP